MTFKGSFVKGILPFKPLLKTGVLSECLRATQRKVAPRPSEKQLLKASEKAKGINHMKVLAPRSSEASLKTYERSDS